MYCLYAVQSEKRSENGNLDFQRLSWKTAMVLAASENPYGDTGGFCAIPRAKNIYARGMELDKYIAKINLGKYRKRMYYDLTKGKISKNLILFALPMMAGNQQSTDVSGTYGDLSGAACCAGLYPFGAVESPGNLGGNCESQKFKRNLIRRQKISCYNEPVRM